MNLLNEFKSQSVLRIRENLPRIVKCLTELKENEIWQHPNKSSNSAGNLILHLCGNITQYVISSIGHEPDKRNRDAEFEATGGFTKAELIDKITTTIDLATKIIEKTDEDEILRVRRVQGEDVSGVNIIIHVTEHLSYHTGQIAFWTKLLKNKDMGFYAGQDLNRRNE